MERIWVTKESGEREPFDPSKAKKALRRVGMSGKETDEALGLLRSKLKPKTTTKRIYGLLYGIIDDMRPEISHKYNLKRALLSIGPEGYEFEDFIAKLLSLHGYRTELRQTVQGKCVSHEIDVIAAKNRHAYAVECKFHNRPGTKCRIQTALYVYSRYLDLAAGSNEGRCRKFIKPWLVTNTKFSEDVVSYAECMDMPLLGWHYPFRKSLESMIDRTRCYPVTVINMRNETLRRLLRRKIVTVFDIPESADRLAQMAGVPHSTARHIVEQAAYAR